VIETLGEFLDPDVFLVVVLWFARTPFGVFRRG
jgi:hypothetical protein